MSKSISNYQFMDLNVYAKVMKDTRKHDWVFLIWL